MEPDNVWHPKGEDYLCVTDFFHKQYYYAPKPFYSRPPCTIDAQHLVTRLLLHLTNNIVVKVRTTLLMQSPFRPSPTVRSTIECPKICQTLPLKNSKH